jgi:hypothetical protein
MKRREYVKTREGQRSRYKWRKYRRVFARFEHELRSKNSMNANERIAFQRGLGSQLAATHRRAFRSPVILDITFTTNQPNPPEIHTLSKNYIDLLQAPISGSGQRRSRLLVNDDRQVSILTVHYRLGSEPSICLSMDSRRHFEDDLRLLQRIRQQDFALDRHSRISSAIEEAEARIRTDTDNYEVADEDLEYLLEHRRNREFMVKHGGLGAFEIEPRDDTWVGPVPRRGLLPTDRKRSTEAHREGTGSTTQSDLGHHRKLGPRQSPASRGLETDPGSRRELIVDAYQPQGGGPSEIGSQTVPARRREYILRRGALGAAGHQCHKQKESPRRHVR